MFQIRYSAVVMALVGTGTIGCAHVAQPVGLGQAKVTSDGDAGALPRVSASRTAFAPGTAPEVESEPATERAEVVVYDTSMFMLTTPVEANHTEHVLAWSECVTPLDEADCCWQWLTACDDDTDDASCRFHVVHGCYLDFDES